MLHFQRALSSRWLPLRGPNDVPKCNAVGNPPAHRKEVAMKLSFKLRMIVTGKHGV